VESPDRLSRRWWRSSNVDQLLHVAGGITTLLFGTLEVGQAGNYVIDLHRGFGFPMIGT
jgi:hypothetical protein